MSLVRMVEKSLMEGSQVWLHFPRSSLIVWICSEGLLPTKEDDILKQRQAFFSIRWLSASSCSDSGSLTMETAISVKSHLKKWLFSLPRGVLQAWILYYKLVVQDTEFQSRRAAARCAAFLSAFRDGIGRIFKNAPITNHSHLILIDFQSSEVGTLKTGSLQHSIVQPTRAFSVSISNVNISFCT